MIIKQNLYTALVTPFTPDGTAVDLISLESILRMQSKAKNGILLLGSTGESLSLSQEEKKAIVNLACDMKLKGEINTQIIIGVPSYNIDVALEWLSFTNDLPIDGYLMTTPIYTKPGIIGQTKWFEKLLENSNHSVILYNIPGRAGIKLHPEVVKNLSAHPRFVAIKDSGGTIEGLREYKIAAPEIAIFCGDDNMMNSMAAEGAVGLISVASNVWASEIKIYVENCLSIHTQKLSSNQILNLNKAFKALFSASNPIPIKALMKAVGIVRSDCLRLPLSREDLNSCDTLIGLHEQIHS